MRKYEIPQKLSRKKAVVVFCISTLLAWLSKVVIEWGTNRMLGYPAGGTSFVSYVSPFIVINAVALLCFFARTEFRSKALRKGIAVLSPAALEAPFPSGGPPGEEGRCDPVEFVTLPPARPFPF